MDKKTIAETLLGPHKALNPQTAGVYTLAKLKQYEKRETKKHVEAFLLRLPGTFEGRVDVYSEKYICFNIRVSGQKERVKYPMKTLDTAEKELLLLTSGKIEESFLNKKFKLI